MEIFLRNLPDQATEQGVERFLRPRLAQFSVHDFSCHKLRSRGCATLTVLDHSNGRDFLEAYGQQTYSPLVKTLRYMDREIRCSRSKNEPDPMSLKVLEKERKDRLALPSDGTRTVNADQETKAAVEQRLSRNFTFRSMCCGLWDYIAADLVFISHFEDTRMGTATFGSRVLTLSLPPPLGYQGFKKYRMEIFYGSVRSMVIGSELSPSVTLLLEEAPRIYKDDALPAVGDLASFMEALNLRRALTRKPPSERTTSLCPGHADVVANCLAYRLVLLDPQDLQRLQALRNVRGMPPTISWTTSIMRPRISFVAEMSTLRGKLSELHPYLPFGLKFQLQRLAQNSFLSPGQVISLLPEIEEIAKRSGGETAVDVIRKLTHQIPFPGPHTEAEELASRGLIALMRSNETFARRERRDTENFKIQHDHIVPIYKAIVTPTGTYFYGPDLEARNRVLRKYADFTSYFLRVSFQEEDGEPIRFDRDASNEEIFHSRFKGVLSDAIDVAGRRYEFLGFSHSSMRAQTCWFVAPFEFEGKLLHAKAVIAKLGDFSRIRSPAKCAARIGQAFSDTFSAVSLPEGAVKEIEDVTNAERVFSDGVGTISVKVLEKIWKECTPRAQIKPTIFQIRYAGAKGMLSLDNRLSGEVLCLRPSMIKFTGGEDNDVEICGAAFRPLPMYLNRQLIKILEDLGVPETVFMNLQEEAVEALSLTTSSATKAASYLEKNSVGESARVPWLLRTLDSLGLPFQADHFLRDTVELAVLMSLREIKHRSRIPVQNGATLYGIMDETGYLEEGEIYCVVTTPSGRVSPMTGPMIVTRSPALHPGDVQAVRAVDVPANSPLAALLNCVVFSQKGNRDLPSQLSGGDLDGDLYHVIYDESLRPKWFYPPADYPRVSALDIGRPVEREDMYNFFINFMESDQLGRIATLHMALADQAESGTMDERCLILADLHSTAVDFSKTGIPVNLTKIPRHNSWRPDFMASGPRIEIEKGVRVENLVNQDDDGFLDTEKGQDTRHRHYESQKVLGKLYRAIDERNFLEKMQRRSEDLLDVEEVPTNGLLCRVWEYVLHETQPIQWQHHVEWAGDIKETYEDNLTDTMYQYATHPSQPVDELEVFLGSIIGKNWNLSKRQRELSKEMKEKYERDVAFTIDCILRGGDGASRVIEHDALEKTMACLSLGVEVEAQMSRKTGKGRGRGKGKAAWRSFGWVAAALCLRELEKFQSGRVGPALFT